MIVPSFSEANDAVREDRATPLHLFIYHNEPISYFNPHWRQQFREMVDFLSADTGNEAPASPSENQLNTNKHE